ncbi:MAG TPA: carboxyltransferase domain-containing protein, partial [Thermoanaerobaculia bacterium]|nr:carboxyltransferase domain-containing protein [Thermoanaerobaculia bacterium]
MTIRPAGDHALLADLGDVTAHELHAAAQRVRALPGVVRCTPGHSSLYVIFDAAPDPDAVLRALAGEAAPFVGAHHTMHVHFAGEDLDAFLAHAKLSREEFLTRVRDVTLTARYLGFRAGFAYLDGWPWPMPRRATSRFVKRGSFAIAGEIAGFYPLDSPGGWNVLGQTNAPLRIEPGDTISLVPVDAPLPLAPESPQPRLSIEGVEIIAPLAVRTDRPFDEEAARLACEAVASDGPVLECAMVGPRLRFHAPRAVAWCDPALRLQTWSVSAGEEIAIGKIEGGLRGYASVGAAGALARRTDAKPA